MPKTEYVGKMIVFKVGPALYENFRRIGAPLGLSANTAARYLAMKALEQARANEAVAGMGALFSEMKDFPGMTDTSSPVPQRKRRKA